MCTRYVKQLMLGFCIICQYIINTRGLPKHVGMRKPLPQDWSDDVHLMPQPRKPDSPTPQIFWSARQNYNPHNYKSVINPQNLCPQFGADVFIIVLIRTIFSHYDRRMAIRDTWAAQERFGGNITLKFGFLFGLSNETQIQRAIERESEIYEDIIQEDYVESYANLTLKTVMAWKWATHFCHDAKFVMVTDDTVFIDTKKVINYLKYQVNDNTYDTHYQLCYLFPCCTRAYHIPDYKYAVSEIKYPGMAYPSYCSMVTYAASPAFIRKLYLMSIDTPSFMPDDAWAGVLVEKMGLQFHDTYRYFVGVSAKEALLPSFLDKDYTSNPVMVALLDVQFSGRESAIIRSLWSTILKHYNSMQETHPSLRHKNHYFTRPDAEENNVYMFALLLMCIDIGIILFIIFVVLYKKRCNRCWVLKKV